MCGIFASFLTDKLEEDVLFHNGNKCSHRGPDNTTVKTFEMNHKQVYLMFHRLSINGLSDSSNQPMEVAMYPGIILMCNGEIYNFKELAKMYDFHLQTQSDCEIIIHLYHLLGFEKCVSLLDGVFSIVLIDENTSDIMIARDPFGVRSLYWTDNKNELLVSSELKSISDIDKNVSPYPPGTMTIINNIQKRFIHKEYFTMDDLIPVSGTEDSLTSMINEKLKNAVKKRLLSDRPIGCLLSGGIDSSIIAMLLSKMIYPRKVRTFSIGMSGSRDLECARLVSEHIQSDHTEVIVTEEDMIHSIDRTIKQIESFDTTTVRASTPMYLLSKYIVENTDIRVIFSGEGADEISGSYLYFHNAPNVYCFQSECMRLLQDIHYFDVLRGDKTTAGNGLEIRVPFLDKEFVRMYMGIDPSLKMPRKCKDVSYEKYLLRKTFEKDLPDEIIWRRKDGFSDSVSSSEKLWCSVIQEHTSLLYKSTQNKHIHLQPKTSEQLWYRDIFNKYYPPENTSLVPYLWLPKWTNIDDPSGRKIIT